MGKKYKETESSRRRGRRHTVGRKGEGKCRKLQRRQAFLKMIERGY